jgi:hypothetical protein
MFRSNWTSSGVEIVMIKDSTTHCNRVVSIKEHEEKIVSDVAHRLQKAPKSDLYSATVC